MFLIIIIIITVIIILFYHISAANKAPFVKAGG